MTCHLRDHHVTFSHEVAARGLFGILLQRGLEITIEDRGQHQIATLTAYTPEGPSRRARLEVPVEDLRRLARTLLNVADQAAPEPVRRTTVDRETTGHPANDGDRDLMAQPYLLAG